MIHDKNGDGVAASKNRCIAALMDLGCEHHFYADDDCWPITPYWEKPYVDNSEPHLMHCWGRRRYLDMIAVDDLSIWSWPRGVLLYVERKVIESIGGMRTEFGRWGGEHAEWSKRIHNAGWTRYRFADAASARKGIWHCEDYERSTPSSVPSSVRGDTAHRHALYDKYRGSTDYVEFRIRNREG